MMKVVFYPTYFKVKRLGPSKALVVSTIAVFLTTWILHSYQWFWLRGGFPITAQDIFFWGILGGLVVYGALRESKAVKTAAARARGWSWHKGLQATVTFSCFCLLWSLWSTESVTQWLWMFGAATDVDPEGVFLLVGTFATIFVLGGRDWNASGNATGWVVALSTPRVRTAVPLVLLVVAASPAIHARVPEQVATTLASLQSTSLNARDAALQHRGYYEQLDARATIVGQEALAVVDARRENWKEPAAVGILNERNDLISRDLIPLRHIQWNGNTFSTNQWGMRDREYTLEKPAGTLRIALMGPSHVMGNGVSDGETFENLVEERLNREYRNGKYTHFEILNFGVDGYTMNQQVALMEDRVFDFAPDIIIVTHYHRIRVMTERYLQKVIWANAAIPPGPLQALLTQAGLNDIDRGRVPVPFATVRKAVRLVGIDPRMPSGESGTRVRWIADEALQESFRRFNEVTRSKDVQPMVLTLNAVIDDEPPEPTHLALFNQLHLPLLNLWHIYPEAERAALRVAPWDDHPNAGGHRLIADRLYEQLVSFLESDTLEGTQRTLH
jgi:lysophospholipase L1-like esterase